MTADSKQPTFRASLQASVAVAGTHPAIAKGDRAAVRFWSLLSGIILLGGVVYALIGGWYWAPIGIAAWFIISGTNQRSAAQVILRTAANDPLFEDEMLKLGVLIRT